MSSFRIVCPGCQVPLGVPPTAVGKPAHCPHCELAFFLPANADGTPGTPQLRKTPRVNIDIPRFLIVPACVLLMIGFAGTMVNGYLSGLFINVPGSDLEYARGRVREIRINQGIAALGKPTDEDWEQAPHAAVIGSALAIGAADVLEEARNEQLAAAWQPAISPISHYSTVMSVITFIGGLCILRGRFYWLGVLGCVAAIVNVNHLCCVPGGIVGVWGILSLVRDEGRSHFGIGTKNKQPR